MTSRVVVCEGCDTVKRVPLIDVGDGTKWDGLCSECERNYGMQAGDRIRLVVPLKGHPDELEVRFVQPERNAIRIAFFSDGVTEVIPWSAFHRPPRI
jgi:hypothetical protein